MKTTITTACLIALQVMSAQAETDCVEDAKQRATGLLTFHFSDGGDEKVEVQIDDKVEKIAPAAALKGNGQFDVFEVYGYIYKATYRMHFLYAQIPGSCVLMGQELIEVADPY